MEENQIELSGNKYFTWYWNICNRAKDRVLSKEIYIERHHKYPKGLYGQNKELVKLTAKEHYIVHLVLWFGLRQKFGIKDKRTSSMCSAFNMMRCSSDNQKRYSAKDYSLFKQSNSEAHKGKKRSIQSIIKQKETFANKTFEEKELAKNKIKNTISQRTEEEIKQIKDNMSKSAPKTKSDIHKKNISESHLGIKRTWYSAGYTGKHHNENFKISQSNKTKNRRWYTNGQNDIFIDIISDIPDGYKAGRSIFKRNKYGTKNEHKT